MANSLLRIRPATHTLYSNSNDSYGAVFVASGEKLAKISGIILGHPGLTIAVEAHTDSVGGDDYNLQLSEHRANSVRTYLVSQGLTPAHVSAKGFGKTMPVADNTTAAGRQLNRRVEMVTSASDRRVRGTVRGEHVRLAAKKARSCRDRLPRNRQTQLTTSGE